MVLFRFLGSMIQLTIGTNHWMLDHERWLLLGLAADMPCAKSLQSCLTFCDPMDCSLPGSSVHGILRQEYWNTGIGSSPLKGSSQCRDQTHISYISWTGRWVLYHYCYLERPNMPCAPLGNSVSGLQLSLHNQCSASPQGSLTVAKAAEISGKVRHERGQQSQKRTEKSSPLLGYGIRSSTMFSLGWGELLYS